MINETERIVPEFNDNFVETPKQLLTGKVIGFKTINVKATKKNIEYINFVSQAKEQLYKFSFAKTDEFKKVSKEDIIQIRAWVNLRKFTSESGNVSYSPKLRGVEFVKVCDKIK